MAGELTADQCRQVGRLMRALRKARDVAEAMPLTEPARARALRTLVHAYYRMDRSSQNIDDLTIGALMVYLKKETYANVRAVIRSNCSFKTLHSFGSLPRLEVDLAFSGADLECPLELSLFHDAYQKELEESP